jgi:hypothetical protein
LCLSLDTLAGSADGQTFSLAGHDIHRPAADRHYIIAADHGTRNCANVVELTLTQLADLESKPA